MSRVRENLIRKLVRELIKQELDEANSTASVGGSYNTPHAFGGSNKKGKGKGKAGYTGGHDEPTDGTGHFIAKDPKLRKESVVNEVKLNELKMDMEKFTDKLTDALQGITVDLDFSNKHSNKIEKMMTAVLDVDFYYQVKDKKELIKGLKIVKSNVAKIKSLNKSVFDKQLSDIDKAYKTFEENIQKRIQISESVKESVVNEGRYHAWRNDDTKTPKQKIGLAMRETRDNLTELERMVNYNVKLKNELKVDSRDYWKNTHKALSKISERLVRLANKVGQLH